MGPRPLLPRRPQNRSRLSVERRGSPREGVDDVEGRHDADRPSGFAVDDDDVRRTVTSQDVNDYLREAMGADFSSKHFRTWGGTKTAAGLLATTELPDTQRAQKIVVNKLIDEVAERQVIAVPPLFLHRSPFWPGPLGLAGVPPQVPAGRVQPGRPPLDPTLSF